MIPLCKAYSIAMIIDVVIQIFILGYGQFNVDTMNCASYFFTIVDVHLYYKHVVCLLQSAFVFYLQDFIAPFINTIMMLDVTDEHQPFE